MSDFDPTDLDAMHERQSAAAATDEQEARWEIEDLVWLVNSKRGRRTLRRILENAGVYRSSFVPGDPFSTAFNEGQRNIGIRLMTKVIGAAPSDYARMVEEKNNG